MNSEIERKLNDKIDKWELFNLQSENRNLKDDIIRLEKQIMVLETAKMNHHYVLERLFSLLAEQSQFSDISTQIYELLNCL